MYVCVSGYVQSLQQRDSSSSILSRYTNTSKITHKHTHTNTHTHTGLDSRTKMDGGSPDPTHPLSCMTKIDPRTLPALNGV